MRVLVTGAAGMLGQRVVADATARGWAVSALTRAQADLTSEAQTQSAIAEREPEAIVHCAAYTDVDGAESDEAAALAGNRDAALNVARAAEAEGSRMVYVSTDYVFDGTATTPYAENAAPSPRSAYGRTKLFGEQAVLRHPEAYVVRTAWLYGAAGNNFVKTMLGLEKTRDTLSVVDDQVGQPTWSRDLAAQLILLGSSSAAPGIYHGTNSGQTSWYGFTRRIFELAGADPDRVLPTTTDEFPRPAPRPAYSVLGHERWREQGMQPMRPWEQALADALPQILADAG